MNTQREVVRSSRTGRFVIKKRATTNPATTVTETIPAGGSSGTRIAYRSAITGRFVTKIYALDHPATTLKERD